ncbi:MAG: fibronectin type III-like domain-contianing protein, partial [Betaproteobacteria bacterium]|nr:fibronectin type III-like domain-contianing protein [Betaproteobacteria bacterium]
LSAIVKNSGTRAGDEVVQLYIHQRYGTSTRPIRELKGFQRMNLAPGEAKTVEFQLSSEDLSYWSSVTKSWIQDESKFDVWVGGDSYAELSGSFEVTK